MDFEVLIPEGYEVVETQEVVESEGVFAYSHFFKSTAHSHADHLNAQRIGPLYRYEVVRPTKRTRNLLGGWWHRWMVVPYQNVLRKKEP